MSSFSLNEIIEFAVQIEQNGYAFYDNAINRKDLTENSRKLLTHLRDEEIAHEITFKNMRDEIALNEIDNSFYIKCNCPVLFVLDIEFKRRTVDL